VAHGHLGRLRETRLARPGQPGPLRRQHTLFRNDQGDGFPEPGFSKERRLEPQITIGLLTDSSGFPLAVEAFEGNKAETATMVPTLTAFMDAHRLVDITVVADAGMLSDSNKREIEAAGLGFILGQAYLGLSEPAAIHLAGELAEDAGRTNLAN
jgi:Transposase DDE domain